MTLRSLQIFVAVAECGNMTKAAEKLFISQPSVSLAISDIEREYDVTLFNRNAGKIQLTHTGRKVLEYARKILSLELDMEKCMRHEAENYCIRVGATITVGATIIGPVIAKMKESIPKVNYHVNVANTHIIEKMLLDGEVDVAVVEGEISNPNLEVRSFLNEHLVLICPPTHPFATRESINISELADVPLLLREEGSGTRKQFDNAMEQNNVEPIVRWSSYSFGALIDAVENDLGVAVISGLLARKNQKNNNYHICNIEGDDLSRAFKLIYHKDKYISHILSKFTEICMDSEFVNKEFLI